MLLEPNRTQFDLNFRFFGIPVRVHPMFWLLAAFLGFGITRWQNMPYSPMLYFLIWVACVFFSILIHELGHVFMGMAFGTRSQIVLYSFGGLAQPDRHLYAWWQRVLVSFAGPLAGFLLIGAVLIVSAIVSPRIVFALTQSMVGILGIQLQFDLAAMPARTMQDVMQPLFSSVLPNHIQGFLNDSFWPLLNEISFFTCFFLILQSLFWGLLNLLPVWPLDGGQISRDVLVRALPGSGLRLSLGISFVVAGLLAINSLLHRFGNGIPFIPGGGIFMTIMFGLLAVQSFMQLQQGQGSDPWDPWQGQGRPWERRDPWR